MAQLLWLLVGGAHFALGLTGLLLRASSPVRRALCFGLLLQASWLLLILVSPNVEGHVAGLLVIAGGWAMGLALWRRAAENA